MRSPGLAVESADGRTVTVSGTAEPAAGDLVVADTEVGPVLSQVVRHGSGVVLGALRDGRLDAEVPAFDAPGHSARPEELEALQRATGSGLDIGTWRPGGEQVSALLRASGFNRHTFLCGQSGSGKTYALGVVLERLLLDTELRVVVLDPNSDFVHLGSPRPEVTPGLGSRIAGLGVRVLGAQPPAEPLRMRFATMPRPAQAAVLRLDPLADRGEYSLFMHSFEEAERVRQDLEGFVARLMRGGTDERALAQRVENLGLDSWEVWAGEHESAAEVVQGGARATVLDLAGFADPLEGAAVCLDLVERLWADRRERRPVLLVIDEAHNICPAEPVGEVPRLLVDRLVQIAAEGRKYGLWLLLSTQRPSKVHQQVISQCDNLMMMRMNSPADVADVSRLFGFAPPDMIAAAPSFRQGEAVLAGRFVPCPMRVRMGARLTVEGGRDVSVPMPAAPA